MFGRNFFYIVTYVFAIFILALIFSVPIPNQSIVYRSRKIVSSPKNIISVATTTPIIVATSTPSLIKKIHPVEQPIVVKTITTQPTTTPLVPDSAADFESINTNVRSAIVNIFCTTSDGPLDAISGSGVVVSSDGLILTNAHIAEYFLLHNTDAQQNFVDCTIRTGSPARNAYQAELVYLPLIWIQQNADVIASSSPTGTGEHDYAFLKVVSNADGSAVTQPLPYLLADFNQDTRDGDNMLLASYPASFLGGISIEEDLYQTSAIAQVSDLITFASSTLDMISVPGTVVSQKGSSGGAAVNGQGQLVGIITTSSEADTTAGRDLRAITTSYINRDLQAQENVSFTNLVNQSDQIAQDFQKNLMPIERNIITKAILGN